MSKEIERKFLVRNSSYRDLASKIYRIEQGYLNRDPERTVRIRISNLHGFLTIKGKTEGCTRDEFEYEISYEDAKKLIKLCLPPVIEKSRYIVLFDGRKWEIDEFSKPSSSLTVAEIELKSENEQIVLPPFIGTEVTGDPRYYNSNIIS